MGGRLRLGTSSFAGLMKADEQDRIVDQIVNHMKPVQREIQRRAVGNFAKCDATFGDRPARGLGLAELIV